MDYTENEQSPETPQAAAAEATADAAPEARTPAEDTAPEGENLPEDAASADAAAAQDAPPEEGAPAEDKAPAANAAPDWKGMYARAMADFDNFRKRTSRDREDLLKYAAADVLKALLPTVDDLARALEKADPADAFVAGVKLVYDGLLKKLADQGATPIDSLGEPLDTNFHEAIATLPSPDVPEGHVMNEVKRGWLLHGKVLRAAQVVVSSGKGA